MANHPDVEESFKQFLLLQKSCLAKLDEIEKTWNTLQSKWNKEVMFSLSQLAWSLTGSSANLGILAVAEETKSLAVFLKLLMQTEKPPTEAQRKEVNARLQVLKKSYIQSKPVVSTNTLRTEEASSSNKLLPDFPHKTTQYFVESTIVVIDDDRKSLDFMKSILERAGYFVFIMSRDPILLASLTVIRPDIVLLDVTIAENAKMDYHEVCKQLQGNEATAYAPVIFLASPANEQDKAKISAMGGVDYLIKPVDEKSLLEKVKAHLKTATPWDIRSTFLQFKAFLAQESPMDSGQQNKLANVSLVEIYSQAGTIGFTSQQMAQAIAKFLKLPYITQVAPETVSLGILPIPFCKSNYIVPVTEPDTGEILFVLSNPFLLEILDVLKRFAIEGRYPRLCMYHRTRTDYRFVCLYPGAHQTNSEQRPSSFDNGSPEGARRSLCTERDGRNL